MDELIIGEKRYVSSKRAAEITGYAKDYVGQLCREGYVEAKMVGRSWYVLESSIREHRFGSDQDARRSTDKETKALQGSERALLRALGDFAEADEDEMASREPEKSPVSDWERPTYRSEAPTMIPDIAPRISHETDDSEILASPAPVGPESAIADMQAAWKEWFEQKRTENTSIRSPHAADNADNADADADESEIYKNDDEDGEIQEELQGSEDEGEGEEEAEEEPEGVEIPIQRRQEPPEADKEAVRIPMHKIPGAAPITHAPPIAQHVRPVFATPPAMQKPQVLLKPKKVPAARKRRASLVANALLIAVAAIAISVALIGSGKAKNYESHPVIKFLGGTSTIEK